MSMAVLVMALFLILICFCGFKLRGAMRLAALAVLGIALLMGAMLQLPPKTAVVRTMLEAPQYTVTLGDRVLTSQRVLLGGDSPAGVEVTDSGNLDEILGLLVPGATVLESNRVDNFGPDLQATLVAWRCLLRRGEDLDSVVIISWQPPATLWSMAVSGSTKPRCAILRFQDLDASYVSALELQSQVREDIIRRIIAREGNVEVIMKPVIKLESGSELLTKYSARGWWRPETARPDGRSKPGD